MFLALNDVHSCREINHDMPCSFLDCLSISVDCQVLIEQIKKIFPYASFPAISRGSHVAKYRVRVWRTPRYVFRHSPLRGGGVLETFDQLGLKKDRAIHDDQWNAKSRAA